ncbi:MAG: PilZ domain-containing protein [bacterium]
MTPEKRVLPRFDERSIVSIKVKRTGENAGLSENTLFCFTRDISEAGLSFTAHFPPTIGSKLSLSIAFSSPIRNARNLTGRVAWVKRIPNGTQHVIGVDLGDSDPGSLRTWKNLVAERATAE